MAKKRAAITAVGHYVPDRVLSNADLEKMVETNDQWIRSRTGIYERRILENGATSDMAACAMQALLKNRGLSPSDVEVIIVATVTPDMFFPSTACLVQQKTGAMQAWASMFRPPVRAFRLLSSSDPNSLKTAPTGELSSSAQTK